MSVPPRRADRFLLLATGLVLGASILYPALRLLVRAVPLWDASILDGRTWATVANTLLIAAGSVVTSGLAGTLLAFLMTRVAFPGRAAAAGLAYLPFALPPLVGVLSFYYLIGPDGFVSRGLQAAFGVAEQGLTGPLAILIIHTYSFSVFYYAAVSAALQGLDRSQVEAARTLGASRARVFWRVTLPALRPALLAAALLTYMSAAASFSAPFFFGKGFRVLTVQIYEEQTAFHEARALSLTLVLAAVALAGVVVLRARRTGTGGGKGVAPPAAVRRGRWLITLGAWGITALLVVPHAIVVWLAFADHRAWHTEWAPPVYTLGNFRTILADARAFEPIRNSLWMSAAAVAAMLATGLPAAYLIARRRAGHRWINVLVMLPWALPGTVIAMNLIVAFNDPWVPAYGVVWMLPLAYFVRGMPLFARMAAAAIEPFDAGLMEAGQTLGATPLYVLRRVALPLILPGVVAATGLAFALSLGEFVASILLYTPANVPIAVKINMEWRGDVGAAFAYSVFLVALVTVTFAAARRVASRAT